MVWVAYSIAWICTTAAVIYGIHETGRLICVFTLLIPAMMSISSKSNDSEEPKKDNVNKKEEDE